MPKPQNKPAWREIQRPRLHRWERARYFARVGQFRLEVSVRTDDCVIRVLGREPETDAELELHREIVQQGSGGITPSQQLISRARVRCVAAVIKLQRKEASR